MASQLPPPLKFSDAIVGILGQLGIAKELCDGRIAWVCVDPAINLLQGNGETSSVRKVDMVIIDVDGVAILILRQSSCRHKGINRYGLGDS